MKRGEWLAASCGIGMDRNSHGIRTNRCLVLFSMCSIFLLLWPSGLRAEESSPPAVSDSSAELEQRLTTSLTLPDLIAFAYQKSPEIKAARFEWRAATEKYRVDTALADPDVMVEGMFMEETFGDQAKPDDWKVTLTQPLPLPGQLSKAGQVATVDAGIARLRLDSTVRDITSRIRESYHELLYLREAQRLAEANREVLDQLRKAGETAAGASRASLVDVMKAQAQSGQVQYDVLLLEELTRTEQTRLNSILDRNPDAPFGDLSDVPLHPLRYSLDEIYPLAEVNLEEIKVAQANIHKARAMYDLARYQTWPQFKLGLFYAELDRDQQIGVQAGLMLPIWYGKNSGRLEGAQADVDTMQAMYRVRVNETRATIRDTFFRLQNSERLVALYQQDLVPQAVRAMQTAETWFTKGQGSLTDYLETVGAWYNFQLALARSKADYGKFLARLESLAGRTLTERETEDGAVQEHRGDSQ